MIVKNMLRVTADGRFSGNRAAADSGEGIFHALRVILLRKHRTGAHEVTDFIRRRRCLSWIAAVGNLRVRPLPDRSTEYKNRATSTASV